jgi:CheY-like chemotaxis protein
MLPRQLLIGSKTEANIQLCEQVASELGAVTIVKKKIADILLSLQEDDFNVIVFDLDIKEMETLKAIRLIRRMRPKIPLITLAKKIDKQIGGKILSEGVFPIIIAPPNKKNLSAAICAILNRNA